MLNSTYSYIIPESPKSIIKVFGVGGGGSNAVSFMYEESNREVEFVVCNTDKQALDKNLVPHKIQIGKSGLGAGQQPEVARIAAEESEEQIRKVLSEGTKMVFVTAGMGGGTGTGAAPIIAAIAKDMGILTVGIVTTPFKFEGPARLEMAKEGIKKLKASCDTVLVILNDEVQKMFGKLPVTKAFGMADLVLSNAAKSISDIVTKGGKVNLDFEDVNTVMKGSGTAVIGMATASGQNRAMEAAEQALNSPLLNNRDINGATKLLVSVFVGDEELTMEEFGQINTYFQNLAGSKALLKFGYGVDVGENGGTGLGDQLKVSVIATGFSTEYQDEMAADWFGTEDERAARKAEAAALAAAELDANNKKAADLAAKAKAEDIPAPKAASAMPKVGVVPVMNFIRTQAPKAEPKAEPAPATPSHEATGVAGSDNTPKASGLQNDVAPVSAVGPQAAAAPQPVYEVPQPQAVQPSSGVPGGYVAKQPVQMQQQAPVSVVPLQPIPPVQAQIISQSPQAVSASPAPVAAVPFSVPTVSEAPIQAPVQINKPSAQTMQAPETYMHSAAADIQEAVLPNPVPKLGTESISGVRNAPEPTLDPTDDRRYKIEAEARRQRLKNMSQNKQLDAESMQNLEQPAYLRKKLELTQVPEPSKRQISRLFVNEDNDIVRANNFLHDRPD